MFSACSEGDELSKLVVWGHDAKRGLVLLSAKPSYREAGAQLPRTPAELLEGLSLVCVADGPRGDAGFGLRVWGDLPLFCFRDRLCDGYVSASEAAAIELPTGGACDL